MITTPGVFDLSDKVMLIHSMMKANDKGMKLGADQLGRLDKVAQYAAEALAGLVAETNGWDGVLWYERLERHDGASLARTLLLLSYKEFNPGQRATNPFDESGATMVWAAIKIWLASQEIPLSYWGKLL